MNYSKDVSETWLFSLPEERDLRSSTWDELCVDYKMRIPLSEYVKVRVIHFQLFCIGPHNYRINKLLSLP